jgi:hypothetical protein
MNKGLRAADNITDADGKLLAGIWDHEGVIMADVNPKKHWKFAAGTLVSEPAT